MGGPPGGIGGDDSILAAQAADGDQAAFAALVRRYERLVFHIAGGFLRNRADVEEAAQEAFLKAFEALDRFRPGARFGPWISRIVSRVCYDRLRQRRRRAEVAWEELPLGEQRAAERLAGGRDPEDPSLARDLAERLLEGLSPAERQVLILVDALGYTPGQAAETLGCSPVAARVRLFRARRALRGQAARLAGAAREEGGADGSL